MSNTNTFEMPHIEITGKIERALAYSHSNNMYGVIFRVRVKEFNPRRLGGDSVIKVNVPMNKHEDLICEFERITADEGRINYDNVEINEYVGLGIRVYARLREVNQYGTEYKVNENYPVDLMDEPILMNELPYVPARGESTRREAAPARTGRTFSFE